LIGRAARGFAGGAFFSLLDFERSVYQGKKSGLVDSTGRFQRRIAAGNIEVLSVKRCRASLLLFA
jgi:hypothetical protein